MTEQHEQPYVRPGHGLPIEAEGGGPTGIPFVDDLAAWTAEQVASLDRDRTLPAPQTGQLPTHEELITPDFFDPRLGRCVEHLVTLDPVGGDRLAK